jgi:hypothetical protein
VSWRSGSASAVAGGGDWFSRRRDYFVREAICGVLHLATWFQEIYFQYHSTLVQQAAADKAAPENGTRRDARTTLAELFRHCDAMVGTELSNGPLWQLKDLCHRIWPHAVPGQPIHGVLFDWLIGSLFHECMKLKENLYLLHAYGARTATVDTLVEQIGMARQEESAAPPLDDIRMLLVQIADDAARQLDRVGILFGEASYLLRLLLPDLVSNGLVVRLLAEEEQAVTALWGESLEELFASLCAGGAAIGFCLAGESFFQGQWFQQALQLYERALACDCNCQAALIRVAQLKAVPGLDREIGKRKQVHHPQQ